MKEWPIYFIPAPLKFCLLQKTLRSIVDKKEETIAGILEISLFLL